MHIDVIPSIESIKVPRTLFWGWESSVSYLFSQWVTFSSTLTFRIWSQQGQLRASHWPIHTHPNNTNHALSDCKRPKPLNLRINLTAAELWFSVCHVLLCVFVYTFLGILQIEHSLLVPCRACIITHSDNIGMLKLGVHISHSAATNSDSACAGVLQAQPSTVLTLSKLL